MSKKFKIIEVVESEAVSKNEIFSKDTLITFYNDTSKIKIADGKTAFNSLSYIGGASSGITPETQTALNLKANIASPTFTGTVSGITKTMVGLNNVDNTTDLLKPISTATQTALNAKLTANQVISLNDSIATDITTLTSDFNNLLDALRNSLIMNS